MDFEEQLNKVLNINLNEILANDTHFLKKETEQILINKAGHLFTDESFTKKTKAKKILNIKRLLLHFIAVYHTGKFNRNDLNKALNSALGVDSTHFPELVSEDYFKDINNFKSSSYYRLLFLGLKKLGSSFVFLINYKDIYFERKIADTLDKIKPEIIDNHLKICEEKTFMEFLTVTCADLSIEGTKDLKLLRVIDQLLDLVDVDDEI